MKQIIRVFFTLLIGIQLANAADNTKKLKSIDSKISTVRTDIKHAQSDRKSQMHQLRKTEKSLGKIAAKLKPIQSQLDAKKLELRTLNQQQSNLTRQLSGQYSDLKTQLRAAYIFGRQEKLKILLNQQDPNDVSRTLTYYHYFHEARLEAIGKIKNTLLDLAHVESEIQTQSLALGEIKARYEIELNALKGKRDERQKIVDVINTDIASKDKQLKRLEAQRLALEKLINSFDSNISDIDKALKKQTKPLYKRKGKIGWPLMGKTYASFGSANRSTRMRWKGMLIKARSGQPIRAIAHGRVVYADWFRGFGLLTIIDHGNGFLSLYGHSESLFKGEGEWVSEGEIIASAGNSGGQRRTALYFELRRKGKPVNPRSWCSRKKHVAKLL